MYIECIPISLLLLNIRYDSITLNILYKILIKLNHEYLSFITQVYYLIEIKSNHFDNIIKVKSDTIEEYINTLKKTQQNIIVSSKLLCIPFIMDEINKISNFELFTLFKPYIFNFNDDTTTSHILTSLCNKLLKEKIVDTHIDEMLSSTTAAPGTVSDGTRNKNRKMDPFFL